MPSKFSLSSLSLSRKKTNLGGSPSAAAVDALGGPLTNTTSTTSTATTSTVSSFKSRRSDRSDVRDYAEELDDDNFAFVNPRKKKPSKLSL